MLPGSEFRVEMKWVLVQNWKTNCYMCVCVYVFMILENRFASNNNENKEKDFVCLFVYLFTAHHTGINRSIGCKYNIWTEACGYQSISPRTARRKWFRVYYSFPYILIIHFDVLMLTVVRTILFSKKSFI